MNSLNRIIFQVIFFSVFINWIVLYLVQRDTPVFNWSVVIIVMASSLVVSALVARRLKPTFMKVKFNDRGLFIDDLIKAMSSAEFHPCATIDNHLFFKRTSFFPPQVDVVQVKIQEDNECLITYPPMAAAALTKQMQPYALLRERDFLKETDKLMENK